MFGVGASSKECTRQAIYCVTYNELNGSFTEAIAGRLVLKCIRSLVCILRAYYISPFLAMRSCGSI